MIAKMALAEKRSIHESWAPDREQMTGVAASVRGISKRFKKARVLEDVSFDVAEGESLVLLGASGSGKTTILRNCAQRSRIRCVARRVFSRPCSSIAPRIDEAQARALVKFWDASALIPLLADEPTRERLLKILEADPEMLAWWGTPVEIASALARREREKLLTA